MKPIIILLYASITIYGSCGRRITTTEFPNPTPISTNEADAEYGTEKMDYNSLKPTENPQLEETTPFLTADNNESPKDQKSSKETQPNASTPNPVFNGQNNDTDVKIDCHYFFGEQCRFYDPHQIMLSAPLLKVLARRSS